MSLDSALGERERKEDNEKKKAEGKTQRRKKTCL
jgi:hypothetical protein